MPIYNVATFLPACLDSLAAQTLAPDEIIAVDDGSTDACPQILADYAKRMSNLRIIRQDNAGLSVARNTGLDHARGKWLAFVDSDDFVAPDMYARLVAMAEAYDLDMALINAEYHFEGREPDRPIYADLPVMATAVSGAHWLRERLKAGYFLHMVWMHLYRRAFIQTHRFRFVPRLIHEDVIWSTRALLAAQRVRYDPVPSYCYRRSISNYAAKQDAAHLNAIIESTVFNTYALADLVKGLAEPEVHRLLQAQLVDGAFSVFRKNQQLPQRDGAKQLAALRRTGFFGLLWENATSITQRRRIARHWLRSLVAKS